MFSRIIPGSPASPTGWAHSLLPPLNLDDKSPLGTNDLDTPPPTPTTISPPSSSSAMKKRFSGSITDIFAAHSLHRRRPSLQHGNSPGLPNGSSRNPMLGSSKSRNRSSSAAASRSPPPVLNSSCSMATIASSNSASSSSRGIRLRRDSNSDMVARGFTQPPTGQPGGGTMGGNSTLVSPTMPSFEPGKTVCSQRIMQGSDLCKEDEQRNKNGGMQDAEEEEGRDYMGLEYHATNKATADAETRKATGITRKISDSKRIIRPPSPNGKEDDDGGGGTDGIELKAEFSKDQPGFPPGPDRAIDRESSMSAAASTVQGYTSSSDEASTSSSLRSAGSMSRSTSGSSSRAGLPQTISFSHSKKRGSRPQQQPPPLNLQDSTEKTMIAASTSAVSTLERTPPSRPQSAGPSRSTTSSPLKSISSSSKSKLTTALEVPGIAGSRLSSLAGQTATAQGQKPRSISTTAINAISRSDSNSSATSTSTVPNTGKTNPASNSSSSTASAARQQKGLSSRDRRDSSKVSPVQTTSNSSRNKTRHPPSLEPPLPDPDAAPKVAPAPASGMYWYKAPTYGQNNTPVRAHTCTLVGSSVYVFGGCDVRTCFNELHVFDADSMSWSKPTVTGDIPPPLRAMTATVVGKKLVIFGGGDGPTYYNEIYVFDTVTNRYTRPKLVGGSQPTRRRAHTACLYKNGIWVFGGGDGVKALNDVWRLDVSDLSKPSWKCISPSTSVKKTSTSASNSTTSLPTTVSDRNGVQSSTKEIMPPPRIPEKPGARGYHTANIVGSKLIIFGGSDGDECFRDVWVYDVETNKWKCVGIKLSYPRLSHTATIVGSYLFVVGGHDGLEYSSEVLLLNLVTMQWDKRKVYGMPPSGRGYHGAVLHDSRLFVIGGFDGHMVFNDTYILELAVSSYYSQISHFTIEV